jgi:cyclopropane fatty-acyl-phospholipid synthase-like methyltransferase
MSVKQFSEACERNRDPILAILRTALADRKRVLEIGSGTGQHAAYFAENLPHLSWQASDLNVNHASILAWQEERGVTTLPPPLELDVNGAWPAPIFDAVFTANTCHIMRWSDVKAMFAGVGRLLGSGGVFVLYGPFNYEGKFTSPSNQRFDEYLRANAAHMGIRDFEDVRKLAEEVGMALENDHEMPANNRLLIFSKSV